MCIVHVVGLFSQQHKSRECKNNELMVSMLELQILLVNITEHALPRDTNAYCFTIGRWELEKQPLPGLAF